MSDVELYEDLKKWVNVHHRRNYHHRGLLGDFTHDLWIYISQKKFTKYYRAVLHKPRYWARTKYSRLTEQPLVFDGEVEMDFPDYSTIPSFEFPKPKALHKRGVRGRKGSPIRLVFLNGTEETHDSVAQAAKSLGVTVRAIYNLVGKPIKNRYTNRKISHVKLIEYV